MEEVSFPRIHHLINLGKSSIIDAIMFALGCPVQAFDYKHLVHKADGERHEDVKREMYVQLNVYDNEHKKPYELKRGMID